MRDALMGRGIAADRINPREALRGLGNPARVITMSPLSRAKPALGIEMGLEKVMVRMGIAFTAVRLAGTIMASVRGSHGRKVDEKLAGKSEKFSLKEAASVPVDGAMLPTKVTAAVAFGTMPSPRSAAISSAVRILNVTVPREVPACMTPFPTRGP